MIIKEMRIKAFPKHNNHNLLFFMDHPMRYIVHGKRREEFDSLIDTLSLPDPSFKASQNLHEVFFSDNSGPH